MTQHYPEDKVSIPYVTCFGAGQSQLTDTGFTLLLFIILHTSLNHNEFIIRLCQIFIWYDPMFPDAVLVMSLYKTNCEPVV